MLSIQDKIYQVLWDRRYISIPTDISDVPALIIRNPSLKDYNLAIFYKNNTYNEAVNHGVSTESQILEDAKISGLWSEEDEHILQEVDEYITQIQDLLSKERLVVKQRRLKKEIEAAKDKKAEIEARRVHLTQYSAEYLSNEVSLFTLMQRCVLDVDENLFWPDHKSFLDCKKYNPGLIILVSKHLVHQDQWAISDVREVARSVDWRLIWGCSRNNPSELFQQPIANFNMTQKLLLFWSRVYDSVYEDPKRPNEDIIQNDELLDEWLSNRQTESEDEVKFSQKKNVPGKNHNERMVLLDGYYSEECTCGVGLKKNYGLGLAPRHKEHCIYGRFVPYTHEEKQRLAAQIYNRNPNNIRKMIASEQNKVEQVGLIEEQHLRNRKSRQMLGSEIKVHRKK